MTIIIPSLFRVPRIYQTLIELSNCPYVDEIILIDNTSNKNKIDLPKLTHICEEKNTYINPAWNKAVSLSKTDELCLVGDDTWFDWNYLEKISKFITEENGMIGMAMENYSNPKNTFEINKIQPSYKSKKGERFFGYGCCFFMHKKNWKDIPNGMKLWGGDDWAFYAHDKPNLVIEGLKVEGYISATLDAKELEEEFNPIKHNDMLLIKEEIIKGNIDNFLLNTKWW